MDSQEDLTELTPTDTVITAQDRAARRRRGAPVNQGLPVGPTQYPPSEWCGGYLPATRVSGHPDFLGGILRKADACNIRISFTVPRTYLTTTGNKKGPYSPSRSRQILDRIGNALRDVPEAYRNNLIDVSVLDDMGCKECWNGGISPSTTADHTRYARSVFPSWVPVGLRVEPVWMGGITNWGVDVTVSQWHAKKGPRNISDPMKKQWAWMELQRAAAARVGVPRQIYAVNLGHFIGGETRPATADEMRRHVGQALDFDPEHNCGSLNWQDYPELRRRNDYASAWRELIALAASKDPRSCGP